VTLADPASAGYDIGTNKILKIPNALSRQQIIGDLQTVMKIVPSDKTRGFQVIDHPSAKSLQELLSGISDRIGATRDHLYGETAFHGDIESGLRTLDIPDWSIYSEPWMTPDNPSDGRVDLMIETRTHLLIIEFKRVRPNTIDPTGVDVDWAIHLLNMKGTPYGWTDPYQVDDSSTIITPLDQIRDIWSGIGRNNAEQLEPFQITAELRQHYSKDGTVQTVRELLHKGGQQVCRYRENINKKWKTNKIVKCFVGVQVGYPVIVREVTDDGTVMETQDG